MKKIVFLSLMVVIGIVFWVQIKRGCLSLLILVDAVRSPDQAMMGKLIEGPTVAEVIVTGGNRPLRADLYRPQNKGRHFPLLLVHDVNPAGKHDELLVLLAQDLARAGFLVLVPDLEGLKSLHLRVSDAEEILQSYLYLSSLESARPRGGMLGIGYGAGPLLLASADPRIREKISVAATFGGYSDLRSVMLFAQTGYYEYGGRRGYVRPEASLRWMFAYKNLDLLRSTADREILRKIIEKRNRYETGDADKLAKTLGPEGRAIHAFLLNADQDRFAPLYENLPLQLRELVYQLSPSRAIKYISASFIIAHGTDDFSIPYTESMKLADAVGDTSRAYLALLPRFNHLEPVEPSATDWFQRYIVGGWRLFMSIYELLEKGSSP